MIAMMVLQENIAGFSVLTVAHVEVHVHRLVNKYASF